MLIIQFSRTGVVTRQWTVTNVIVIGASRTTNVRNAIFILLVLSFCCNCLIVRKVISNRMCTFHHGLECIMRV